MDKEMGKGMRAENKEGMGKEKEKVMEMGND